MCKKQNKKRRAAMWVAGMAAVQVLTSLTAVPLGNEGRVYAAESNVTVKEAKGVLYSVEGAAVYSYPDSSAVKVTTLVSGTPVEVLGTTSNGWFQVNINGKYYMQGTALTVQMVAGNSVLVYDETGIKQLTSGTFSFYEEQQLKQFTKTDIEEMDENTYIKYLDSYIMGNGAEETCIIKESGLVLKEHYQGKAQTDATVANQTMLEYLISYRNTYLSDSIYGPIRTQKAMVQSINRAIRYGKNAFTMVFKNASIGSDADKMEGLLKEAVKEIKNEQGITFAYKKSYDNYTTSGGSVASGWVIQFATKDY